MSSNKFSPFFADGQWGFQEHWPPEADGPVFDLLHGDVHVARVWKDSENWRLVLRQTHEMTRSLAYLLQTLAILADRMKAVEADEGKRSGLSAQSAGGEPVTGADAIRRLLDALQTPGDRADQVAWGDSDVAEGAAATASAAASSSGPGAGSPSSSTSSSSTPSSSGGPGASSSSSSSSSPVGSGSGGKPGGQRTAQPAK